MRNHVVLIVALSTLTVIGCSENENPPTVPTQAATDTTTGEPSGNGEINYPRFVAKHVHPEDGEITEAGSPVNPSLVEAQFSAIDWTKPASLGVHLDSGTSLTVSSSPTQDNREGQMIAVWTRPEKEAPNVSVSVVRHSEPFEDKEQALGLLKLFADGDESLESSAKWAIKARGSVSDSDK